MPSTEVPRACGARRLIKLSEQGENDPYRMAQTVRRTVGKWVAKKWRRRPMIVPTVIALIQVLAESANFAAHQHFPWQNCTKLMLNVLLV